MRKVLVIALGIASLVVLAGAQPAFADPRTICQWHLSGAYIGDVSTVQTGPFGIGVKVCKVIDVQVPKTPWKGDSSVAVKTYSPSTNLHKK